MTALGKVLLKFSSVLAPNQGKASLFPLSVIKNNENVVLLLKDAVSNLTYCATSQDGFSFKVSKENFPLENVPEGFAKAAIVPDFFYRKRKVMFFGDRSVNIAYQDADNSWKANPKPLILANSPLEVSNIFVSKQGLLLLYFDKKIENGMTYYNAHLALFDKKNPAILLWKTENPIWEQQNLWPNSQVQPLGSVMFSGKIVSYWQVATEAIYGVVLSGFKYNPSSISVVNIKKHPLNPIISPKAENSWEDFNTFNPAALYTGGKVHILYRAQGFDYVSSVGYASSFDGINIDERLDEPIFIPTKGFEINTKRSVKYDFVSGGGFGGCEDPRITLIGDKVYMIYVAFDGWSPPRLALTSILLNNFLNKHWLWSKPILISPPGIVDKSGCLFPEKIDGKYVFFHRVFPDILVDFVDDLNFDGKTNFLRGQYKIKIRPDKWDSRKIGAGAPPLKTKDGWLLIYYGVDDRDDSKYQIGAMLLDLKNPTKVLYRTDQPIIRPTEEYENTGFKPGVVYPCGAVVVNNQLLVYYGGADSVVCVASADLNSFIEELKTQKPVHLYKLKIKELTCK